MHVAAIRALFAHSRSTVFGAGVMAVYLAVVSAPYSDSRAVAGWFIGAAAFLWFRAAFARRFARSDVADADADAADRWERRFTLVQFAAGLVWGVAALLFVHPDQPVSVMLTLMALVAGASGAVSAQAYSPRSFRVFVVTMMGLVVARFASVGSAGYLALAVAWSFYALTLIGYNRLQAATARDSLRIRFEKERALAQLATEREEAEAARHRAEQASLAKSRFLAAASHDLRQPLYALGLFSASLETLRLDVEARAVVDGIADNIRVMEMLFDNLLDLSKLEAGVVAPQIGPVSVDRLFDDLSQIFHPLALDRGIELRFRVNGEWIASDAALIEQVLANLVSNALRATTRGGVLVAARRRRGTVRLEVWDTGVGIAADALGHIFEEFVQLRNPERDRRKGLGLGLAIAQRAARLLGADIAVRSRPDRGSYFAIAQPAAPAQALSRPLDAGPARRLQIAGLPVLVVDDEADVRRALGDLLGRWGVEHKLAASASEAGEAIAAGRYGLVLADQRLGDGPDGLALIARLREVQPGLPAALVTADLDETLVVRAQTAAVPLLHKPLRPELLRGLLAGTETTA